jgi:hypothetical protein
MKRLLLMMVLMASPALAWDGYDWDTNSYVEIEEGNLVREGQDIEIYDWRDHSYRDVQVEDIRSYGSSVEIEVYDYDKGEYRTLDMDRQY